MSVMTVENAVRGITGRTGFVDVVLAHTVETYRMLDRKAPNFIGFFSAASSDNELSKLRWPRSA